MNALFWVEMEQSGSWISPRSSPRCALVCHWFYCFAMFAATWVLLDPLFLSANAYSRIMCVPQLRKSLCSSLAAHHTPAGILLTQVAGARAVNALRLEPARDARPARDVASQPSTHVQHTQTKAEDTDSTTSGCGDSGMMSPECCCSEMLVPVMLHALQPLDRSQRERVFHELPGSPSPSAWMNLLWFRSGLCYSVGTGREGFMRMDRKPGQGRQRKMRAGTSPPCDHSLPVRLPHYTSPVARIRVQSTVRTLLFSTFFSAQARLPQLQILRCRENLLTLPKVQPTLPRFVTMMSSLASMSMQCLAQSGSCPCRS